ncbi:MAG TPA: periplasmic heavy metal sensor [Gemmatimonadales bacterium]|jgi:Spy/CpxP family protein refolding chaperone|nr:periplasmic heavy metal sensor [Gemmatimonadales bacterium]
MTRTPLLTLSIALLTALAAPAQQGPQPPGSPLKAEDALGRFVFPPELVMQHARDIGLKPEQRTAITHAISELQSKVLDLQWQMQDEVQRLTEFLNKPAVDQAAALAQIDKVLAVERDVKRAHMSALIQIKNTLTPEQQAKLAQARAAGAEAERGQLNAP